MNEDDIDYSDSESDYFPEKDKYSFPNQHSNRRRVKKKKQRKPRYIESSNFSSSSSFSVRALKPRKGVTKKKRMPYSRFDKYQYCDPYTQKLYNASRCKSRPKMYNSSFIFDDGSCYSQPKKNHRKSKKRNENQRENSEECLVCPLNCPYHTKYRKKQKKIQKHSRKHRLSYPHLTENYKFTPDFKFGQRRKVRKRKQQTSPRKRKSYSSHFKRHRQGKRQKRPINPFLSDSQYCFNKN